MEWDKLFDFFRVRLGGAIIDGAIEYHEKCGDCLFGKKIRCVILNISDKDTKELHECDPHRKEVESGLRQIIPFVSCGCKLAKRLRTLKRAEVYGLNGKHAE